MVMVDDDETVSGFLDYDPNLFDQLTIERMITNYSTLLNRIAC